MGDLEAWKVILGTVGSLVGALLLYKGATRTAGAAKEGVNRTAKVDEQQSALEAWKGLLQPHIDEVARLNSALNAEREKRDAREKADEVNRAEEKAKVQATLDEFGGRISKLQSEVAEWKRVARVIARWATTMRDEILRLNGTVPATPDELLSLRAVEDAEHEDPLNNERNP